MKTTIILRDDLVKRAKSKAALKGKSFAKYVEEKLEIAVQMDESHPIYASSWIHDLPKLPKTAANELNECFDSDSFREIDGEMWK